MPLRGNDRELPKTTEALPQLPGLRFLECVQSLPIGEIWRAVNSAGDAKHVYYLHGFTDSSHRDIVTSLKSVSHVAIPRIEWFEQTGGRLTIVASGSWMTLADRYEDCRSQGLPGIPREELWDFCRRIAQALDELYVSHGLFHLFLNPQTVLLRGSRIQLAHFGFMQRLWLPNGIPPLAVNQRYAATEFWEGRYTPKSDQFSLAVLYAELLSGSHPFARHRVKDGPPDTTKLSLPLCSEHERLALTKAVDRPINRFNKCVPFVEALIRSGDLIEISGDSCSHSESTGKIILANRKELERIQMDADQLSRSLLLSENVTGTFRASVAALLERDVQTRRGNDFTYHLKSGVSVQHLCAVNISKEKYFAQIAHWSEQWRATSVYQDDLLMIFVKKNIYSLWRRMKGYGGELTIRLENTSWPENSDTVHAVSITILARNGTPEQSRCLLEEEGPEMIASLRSLLFAFPDLRGHPRWHCNQPLQILPSYGDMDQPMTIPCHGKDISLGGVGFYAENLFPSSSVYINLPWLPGFANIAVPATIVRSHPTKNGPVEIGAIFKK